MADYIEPALGHRSNEQLLTNDIVTVDVAAAYALSVPLSRQDNQRLQYVSSPIRRATMKAQSAYPMVADCLSTHQLILIISHWRNIGKAHPGHTLPMGNLRSGSLHINRINTPGYTNTRHHL